MEHVTRTIVYHGDAAACYSWTPASYVIWTKHLSLHQPWTYLWHLFLDRYHIGRAEDWSAEHQGGCVIVWAFREDCNHASTGFKWRKLYDQTRPSILLCTAVLDGVCTGYVKKKVFRCFFKGFFFHAWHLLFISASPLFATGKPNSNVKSAAALRPTQVLRRIKLLLHQSQKFQQRLSWHRRN